MSTFSGIVKNEKKSHGGGGGSHSVDLTVEPSKLEKEISGLDRASWNLKKCSNNIKNNLEIRGSSYNLIQKSLTSVMERISME